MTQLKLWLIFCILAVGALRAQAEAALLLEEPYGSFGFMTPTGHAAIFLQNVCAVSPVQLRKCLPGEPGVVISRYHNIGGYDWIAIPIVPYLYAVDDPADIPAMPDEAAVTRLRDEYRKTHLQKVAADTSDGKLPASNWQELIGAAYNRKIYAFSFRTSEAQDDRLIEDFNSRENRSHFNLLFHNCADFARRVIDFYYPRAAHRSFLADLGITTPKQIAKSLTHYAKRHPDLELSRFVIAQVPNSRPRSKPARGVLEAVLRSKKYVVPLAIFHPFFTGGLALDYLVMGRFNPAQHAVTLEADAWSNPEILSARSTTEPTIGASEIADTGGEPGDFDAKGSQRAGTQ